MTNGGDSDKVDGVSVLVVGAGAIGGYFGALLARTGARVTMLARGDHLRALTSDGLTIEGGPDEGTAHVEAVASIADAPRADLVLFAVKSYDSDSLAAQLAAHCHENTVVLELQNGVDRAEALRGNLGDRVLAGTVYMESQLDRPGVVRYLSGARRIHFGEPAGGGVSPRADRISRILTGAGIDAQVHADVRPHLWNKFVLVCAANSLTALTRSPFGNILSIPHGTTVVAGLMRETTDVAAACGIDLGSDCVDRSLQFLTEIGPKLRSSMLRDMEMGRLVEVDALNGTVVRLGDEHGVAVPMNRIVTLALETHNSRLRNGEGAR